LDSTSYLVAAGQADPAAAGVGSERSEQSNTAPTGVGYSAVISPRGEVLRSLGAEPGLLVGDLDLDAVSKTRAAIPVLANRRF
jgi:deaminated glutathione amidase